jgi:hypothetical protein
MQNILSVHYAGKVTEKAEVTDILNRIIHFQYWNKIERSTKRLQPFECGESSPTVEVVLSQF